MKGRVWRGTKKYLPELPRVPDHVVKDLVLGNTLGRRVNEAFLLSRAASARVAEQTALMKTFIQCCSSFFNESCRSAICEVFTLQLATLAEMHRFCACVTSRATQHCRKRSFTDASRFMARASMSSQSPGPQKSSASTAAAVASTRKPKLGSRGPELFNDGCRYSDSRHATTTNRIDGSECNTRSTTHAGQPRVAHQSPSSAIKH